MFLTWFLVGCNIVSFIGSRFFWKCNWSHHYFLHIDAQTLWVGKNLFLIRWSFLYKKLIKSFHLNLKGGLIILIQCKHFFDSALIAYFIFPGGHWAETDLIIKDKRFFWLSIWGLTNFTCLRNLQEDINPHHRWPVPSQTPNVVLWMH